jgi:hypothetical protein
MGSNIAQAFGYTPPESTTIPSALKYDAFSVTE